MANIKTGFPFYAADTDRFQDIRIKRLKKDFGCDGFAVYEYILNEIYRVKGCFLVWDESTAFDVADYWGLKETKVNEIVRYCCAVGLFDKALLSNGSVLTSPSIQSRYVDMCIRAKRKEIKIPEEYLKLPEESLKILEEYREKTEVCRKVKNSIGIIHTNNSQDSLPPTPPEGDVPPEKPKRKRAKKTVPSLNAKARKVFEAHYKATFDADYYWTAKDAGNMSDLLGKLKYQRTQKGLPNEDDDVLSALSAFLEAINDNWIMENFSVAIINSKFNELRAQAISKQHGNSRKNSGTHSATDSDDTDLMRHVAAGIARGYYERQQRANGGEPVPGQ